MTSRTSNVRWLRDLLEHLSSCQKQLEWTHDAETTRLLADTMLRDLQRCERLCEAIRQRSSATQLN
jgi:hypothetical protein